MTSTCNMSESKDEATPFEDALDKTGNGAYNVLLVVTCAWILLAIGVDLFGFSLVVAAACDLQLTVAQKGVLTSLPFVGILLVSYVWGYVADTRGRRFSLLLALPAAFVLSCLASLSPHWLFLGLVKFLSVCFSCAANSATYTLVGESCVRRVRGRCMLLMTSLLLLSPAVAAVLAYPTLKLELAAELPWLGVVFRPWRLLAVVLALPTGLGGAAVCFFHESPKFLANASRPEEALHVMKSIYAINSRRPKDDFKVQRLEAGATARRAEWGLLRAMLEQSAPLFRPPLRRHTLLLFYIVAVVYITNNSFLVWLPQIFELVALSLRTGAAGGVCALISRRAASTAASTAASAASAAAAAAAPPVHRAVEITPDHCLGVIEDSVILTLVASQSAFAFLNFIISYLQDYRKTVLIGILVTSAASGAGCNLVSEPVASVFLFVAFTCTCLGMGILASYFVDLYPTSYRGMVACLSIMVGRSSTFVGINLVASLIFDHCLATFYAWSLLVLSAVAATCFLPPDKPKKDVKSTAL